MSRRRVIEWEDPLAAAARGLGMTGIEALEAIAQGRIPPPPIGVLMGFEPESLREGSVRLAVEPAEYHYSNTGAAHGGLAATLLDSVMYLAVHSTLAQGVFASTLEIKVNFVRPMTVETGRVVAEGRLLHRGSAVATAEGAIRDSASKLIAHATTTCLIRSSA